MKVFRKVLKNKLFYLLLILGVFVIPIFGFNLHAQEVETVDYSNKNLAVPDLESKEYLGDGNYRLFNENGITIAYDIYSGIFTINGTSTTYFRYNLTNIEQNTNYSISYIAMSGTLTGGTFNINTREPNLGLNQNNENIDKQMSITTTTQTIMDFNAGTNRTFNNYQFKLQLEKGDTTTSYTVPLQPYLWHEKQLSYETGYNNGESDGYDGGRIDGYDEGYDDGYEDGTYEGFEDGYEWGRSEYGIYIIDGWMTANEYGDIRYNAARNEYGILINGEWVSATDYGELQYNEARDEYGIFYDGEWISAVDYGDIKYNDGYQDGVGDTHDYYDANGLFIPKHIPKGHLVIDYDLRYGEPYFYLQDFSNVDDVYFGFQHNRWLEKAFDWAYSVEEDFLAINDLFGINYESDVVIYKYFFYKYDTDSIYFYNDNGTLLKVVERDDFDYYVYEVPELSQEEQARIDNAYNKGMSDYGYYDSESEEYLTAVEYGDIQYNLGVQSTSDSAYSDGFVVAMWYSHLYGYDWLHTTYYDLIAERPILYNVHDITSFAYQEGYDVGYGDGDEVGYGRGYDWGYEDGLDDGYDMGYDDGEDDGYEDGYNKGYQVATDNTYDAIYDDIYKIGYKDGQKTGMNNKFYSGLEKWIVPAIIVVLFFGLLMLFPKHKED